MYDNIIIKSKNISINGDITFFIFDIVLIFLYFYLIIFTILFTKKKRTHFWFLIIGILLRFLSFSLFIINREGIIHYKYIGDVLFIVHTLGTLCFLTFISSISLLLFSIYNEGNSKKINLNNYENAVIMLNFVIYFIVFSMIFYEFMFSPKEMKSIKTIPYSKTQNAIQLFICLIYLCIGSLSFYIGNTYLFKIIKEINRDDGYYINSFTEFKYKYGIILIIGMLYFLVRAIFTATSIFTPIEPKHGIFEIIFYSLFEIIPISLVIWIIRKLEYEAIELKDSNDEPDMFSPSIEEKI
ncbi:hypothetical protein ACTFIZ_006357 [Dictyostelium cf. discoideum]